MEHIENNYVICTDRRVGKLLVMQLGRTDKKFSWESYLNVARCKAIKTGKN
jgi:hypothetical protein